jgi:serine/threonine protein kinase
VTICINPWCSSRYNKEQADVCAACQSSLIINGRFRLLEAITDLSSDRKTDVYVARDMTGSRRVPAQSERILKVCKSSDPTAIELFEREAETLRLLDYPQLPKSHVDDYFKVRIFGYPLELRCLAMDKINGQTLDQWLFSHGAINQKTALQWLEQFAEILDYLHGEGYIHRDINLSNAMVTPSGDIALIDLGAVRKMTGTYYAKIAYAASERLTRIETFGFTAPEQLLGKAVPQSDFYALGRTFIVLLTGKYFHQLQTDGEYRLKWEKEAKRIDSPLIKYINLLASKDLAKRPKNTAELLSIAAYDLPNKLKQFKFWNKYARFFKFLLAGLISVGLIYGSIYFRADRSFFTARAQVDAQEWQKAKVALQESIDLNPRAEAYDQLGAICQQLQDVNCAKESFQKSIALKPSQVVAYMRLGNLYENLGDFENAKIIYKKAIQMTREHPAPLINLSRVNILLNDLKNADILANQALQFKGIDSHSLARLYKNLAWVYLEKQQYPLAKRYSEQAIAMNSQFISPFCILALANEQLKLKAAEQWRACMTQSSEDAEYPEVKEWRLNFTNRFLND